MLDGRTREAEAKESLQLTTTRYKKRSHGIIHSDKEVACGGPMKNLLVATVLLAALSGCTPGPLSGQPS